MRIFVFFLALTTIIINNSAIAADSEEYIYRSGHDYVKIVSQDAKALPSDHPANYQADVIRKTLAQITYKKDVLFGIGNDKVLPLFSDDQLEKLVKQLTIAFSKVGPAQDVVFSMSGLHDSYIGDKSLSTSARAFIKNNSLNLIFGVVNVDYSAMLDRTTVGEKIPGSNVTDSRTKILNPIEPGSRRKKNKVEEEIIMGEGMRTLQGRPDWLVLDFERFTRVVAEDQPDNSKSSVEPRQIESEETPTSRPQPKKMPSLTLEERLSKLKELKDKGLIDNDAYRQRMNELLDEL